MRIAFVEIQNFRKLKSCRIDFGEETIFVGANNSGKTSAMDALIAFLKKSRRKDLSPTDITLSNWKAINQIAIDWTEASDPLNIDLSLSSWQNLVPALDLWLNVDNNEVHYISHIIPTLDWAGGLLGIRLSFEPKNVEKLYKAYKLAFESATQTSEISKKKDILKLWPRSMRDFLDRELHKFFNVNAYILDPSKLHDTSMQTLSVDDEALSADPFEGLFKIDVINAQRGFTDPNSTENVGNNRRLSSQLKNYFENHLNPNELPDVSDLEALIAIESAKTAFDEKLNESFKTSIGELESLNYPGFSDPKIRLSSKVNPLDGLNHDASVQFNILPNIASSDPLSLSLPEQYNGLGYQNLISMIFNLIRYRDEWMRVGKIGKRLGGEDLFIEPIHVVLIEEPEAHLHAQVQQVFIKKAYDVLRKHESLGKKKQFTTQMVISTHSSHIAHEVDFVNLRYFKRSPATSIDNVPCANVISLSKTFGDDTDTSKFAFRYLKTTHCDLFFADAAILVEGPAERMLIPHFIKSKYPDLDKSYLSILEIGGSHAHRLKPLIDTLGLLTLIITDLDSIAKDSTSKVIPEKGKEYRTGNDTIKTWVPVKSKLDEVLELKEEDKVYQSFVRVAYQHEINLKYNGKDVVAIPYTFEDALTLSNIDLFKQKNAAKGLIKKMSEAVSKIDISECCKAMFDALGSGKKAEMALELLFSTEPKELEPPKYISEGLKWLQEELRNKGRDFIELKPNEGKK